MYGFNEVAPRTWVCTSLEFSSVSDRLYQVKPHKLLDDVSQMLDKVRGVAYSPSRDIILSVLVVLPDQDAVDEFSTWLKLKYDE